MVKWEAVEVEVSTGLTPARWAHVQGVIETAARLAERFGEDPGRARLAGLIHDAARDRPAGQLLQLAREARIPVDALERAHPELLHGPVASHWAFTRWAVDDRQVLDAVRYHTTGRPEASRLEMVLMVADMCEPGRLFAGARAVWELANARGLGPAWGLALDLRLRWLLERGLPVHPRTVAARNWHLLRTP